MARATPPSTPDTPGAGGQRATFEADSTVGLLRRLGDDLATLLREELALATAEVSEISARAQRAVASMASGGAVLFAGFIFVLLGITTALAMVVAFWLASLIVGVVVLIVGFSMLAAGKKKLASTRFKLERTKESLREDRAMLNRRTQ